MRILLDECVNARVKEAFTGHAVKTVAEMGWRGTKDRVLLNYAQDAFDVFVTIDRKLERQLHLNDFKLGCVIVHVPSNEIKSYLPLFSALSEAAASVKLGHIIHVGS